MQHGARPIIPAIRILSGDDRLIAASLQVEGIAEVARAVAHLAGTTEADPVAAHIGIVGATEAAPLR